MTEGNEAADVPASALIDRLRNDEIASIRSEVAAGRRDHILRSLDQRGRGQELIRQQYSGRYPFELLQNANDAAAGTGRPGRVRFVLTDTAVVVADNGVGFGNREVEAICGLGQSSKDPRDSIGYKGLGFKSVGEITARPQIVSSDVSFQFDDERVREWVELEAGSLRENQRLPVYAFPFTVESIDLSPDKEVVEDARRDGFTTVVRLPLKPGVSRVEVEKHLVESLLPRLLLLLLNVEELELQGTGTDFVSFVSRDARPLHEEILLETNGAVEHWLIFRAWNEVDRALVSPLGDAWAEVERVQVAVAVPLDSDGVPSTERLFPLHVYFPTEERTGLPVIIHGDFALQLDRRQLATSPESIPYNEHLIQTAAAFLASTVAPDLASRFPGTAASAAALTPRAAATGQGLPFVQKCTESLRGVRFLAAVDGRNRLPAEALLLPGGVSDPHLTHGYLDLERAGRLLVPAIEADPLIRQHLATQLDVHEWPLAESLGHLRLPDPGDDQDFYKMLVTWADGYGTRPFASDLATAPCVRTTAGEIVAPADKVFFPRRRDDVEIPADLPVPIAAFPEVEGLHTLLEEAGVQDFEWRELMRDYLLPILTDPEADTELRVRATKGLRAYYESQRSGDPVLQRRISETLIEATTATGDANSLRPAGEVYFTSDWTGSDALEQIYGPFGRAEFLAVEPPADADRRAEEAVFLSWVGVAAHPRVLEARAEQRNIYMTNGLSRHPHRSVGEAWDEWWTSTQVQEARRCEQDHPESQQLLASFVLDRFAELTVAEDPARMVLLWTELSQNWGAVYEPATRAVFHCQHTGHGGERDRPAPSLLWHMLTGSRWVPARLGAGLVLERPSDAWRVAFDTPRWVARRVPVLLPPLTTGGGEAMAVTLGVTDAARPRVRDLVALLRSLAHEHESDGAPTREVYVSARWAMRTLNDVLADEPEDADLEGIPLLATYQGAQMFDRNPVVALDPLLAESWQIKYPILDADRDLRRLHEALGLVLLDDQDRGAKVTPLPSGVSEDLRVVVADALAKSKPFLAAVAVANTPSREQDVLRGLKRLEVIACRDLVLRYTFRNDTIDRAEATSYIAVRQEMGKGAVRRNIGTAHLEVDPQTNRPDWYAFGPQLAQFLQVPTQGDAFAVLLNGSDVDRKRYLASRRIPFEAVDAMRVALDLPVDDELDDDLLGVIDELTDLGDLEQEPVDAGEPGEGTPWPTPPPETEGGERDEKPLPPLDPDGITMTDVEAGEVEQKERPGGGSGGGVGPAGPVDHERSDRRQREIGHRGEEAAFEKEKERVALFGGDPDAVFWRSQHNPFAAYDIESLDEDGQRIFIEVKSTTGADPEGAFTISQSELMQALRHRSCFYIYRVTSADTARPNVHRYQDPARLLAEGRAALYLADASMTLGEPVEAQDRSS